MDSLGYLLLNDFQRNFPLVSRPFRVLAEVCGTTEAAVLERLAALRAGGFIGRIGAVIAPRRIGASTLAAMRVPPHRLEAVAEIVSGFTEVNHNYAREHEFNLWFVVTASDAIAVATLLDRIGLATGCQPINLPLQQEYRIDLGFDLGGQQPALREIPSRAQRLLSSAEQRLLCALQDGLDLSVEPFRALARRADSDEESVLRCLKDWCADGTIRRFGVIVRHHELGYCANAMAVWDVPDEIVDGIGQRVAQESQVTLAYRRRRCQPVWPYNLFCMIHGKEREQVSARVREIAQANDLTGCAAAVLYSYRRFKQTGARYLQAETLTADG